ERSPADLEDRLADRDAVTPLEGDRPGELLGIEKGAVGGPEVLQEDAAVAPEQAGVEVRDRLVGQGDAAAVGAAQRQLAELLAQVEGASPQLVGGDNGEAGDPGAIATPAGRRRRSRSRGSRSRHKGDWRRRSGDLRP